MSEEQAGGWAVTPTEFPHAGRLPIPEADREEDTLIVPYAHQVRLFVQTGQLQREVAWSRTLEDRDG